MDRFTVSLEKHLKEKLDAYAQKNGVDRSEAVGSILERFFEDDVESSVDVRQEMAELKARLDQVESGQAGASSESSQLEKMSVRLDLVQHFLIDQHKYLAQVFNQSSESGELKVPEASPPIPLWIDDFPSYPAMGSLGYD
jgi:metal-responsive CopG/Arc/MetJ family transcriptional regulator